MFKAKILFTSLVLVFVLVLSGCSSSGKSEENTGSPKAEATAAATSAPSEAPANVEGINEAVQLTIWHPDPEYAKKTYSKASEKYPKLTLDYVGGELKDLVAAGTVPDLIFSSSPADIAGLQQLDLLAPLDELIAAHNVDISGIRANMLEFFRSYGEGNKLFLLPYSYSTWGLYYNKKIFDKFGVDYPKDGMTWDEVIDLAAKLTKTDGGVQYFGLHPGPIQKMISQTGFGYIDPATDKAIIAGSPEMKKVVELLKRIIDIPGNLPKDKPYDWFMAQQWSGGGEFVSSQTEAMHVTWNNVAPYAQLEKDAGLSWDVVSFPLIGKDFPATDPEPSGDSFGVSKHSKNQAAAVEVLKYFMSNEYQSFHIQATGKASSLSNSTLDEEFQKLSPDKNLKAYITNPPSKSLLSSHSKYERASWTAVDKGIELLIQGEDTNTVLSKMQESADLAIENAKKTE